MTYTGTVVDVLDPEQAVAFWSTSLGWRGVPLPGQPHRLVGPASNDILLFEPTSAGELAGVSFLFAVTQEQMDEMVAQGATVMDADTHPWIEVLGQQGSRLRFMLGDEPGPSQHVDVLFDVPDPATTARFWSRMIGSSYELSADGVYAYLPLRDDVAHTLVLGRGEQPAPGTRRVRLRYRGMTMRELLVMGASQRGRNSFGDWILAAPGGLEFCLEDTGTASAPRGRYGPR